MAEPAQPDDFFVGYLRPPLQLVRILAVALSLLLLGVDAVSLLLYRIQEARASGDWGTEGEVEIEGVLLAEPYPTVLVPATPDVPAHAVLLVSEGKRGAPSGLAPFDGKRVTVQGYPLLRDALTVLQLSQPPRPSEKPGPAPALAMMELGPRTLTGEIVDSKCFLGAMVPGEGKVHAGCASLCLLGDIPPLFVTRGANGRLTYRLLSDESGGPASEAAADHAGEFLTLTGNIRRFEGIEIFAVPRRALD